MSDFHLSLLYISGSVLTFSVASLGYTYFSRRRTPLWMALVKNFIALFFTFLVLVFQKESFGLASENLWPFFVSGFLGLGMADLFLLAAFKQIGPGRSLILFAFQPVFTGVFAYFVWGDQVSGSHILAILFFILCLVFFSKESWEEGSKGGLFGLFLAFMAVTFDAIGILLTKHGFEINPGISAFQVNYLRLVAALLFLIPVGVLKGPRLVRGFIDLSFLEKKALFLICFSGAFLSLIFYMEAIRFGSLAIITSVVLVDPLLATLLECWWYRKRPSPWLLKALVAFLCAVSCLVIPLFWEL